MKRMLRQSQSRCFRSRRRYGQAALLEFALIAPILMVLGFGLVQLGILLSNIETLSQICRDGARYAAKMGTTMNLANGFTQEMKNDCALTSIKYADLSPAPAPSYPDGNKMGGRVVVTLTYDLRKKMWLPTSGGYIFPGMNVFNTAFSVTTTMNEEQ